MSRFERGADGRIVNPPVGRGACIKPRGAMSRRRIWLLLGGLSIIFYCSFKACVVCLYGPPPFTVVFLAWFAWGVAEIAIASRAAVGRRVER